MKTFVLLPLLLIVASPARAQEPMPTYPLSDTVVVTASRYVEDARRTGRRVTVITPRDIAAAPVASFDELLRTAAGVEVQTRGGFGVQSDLSVRGSSFKGVLVLLDGMRMNDPQTGHFLTDFPVPLSEIARIEVLRGPAAALYGPDALGGVVQVFTYAGLRRMEDPPVQVSGQADLRYGRHDLYDAGGAARHTVGPATVSAATAWQGSDGQPLRNAEGQVVRGAQGPVRTGFERQVHTAAVTTPLGGAQLYARAGLDRRDFSAFHYYTSLPVDTAREATTTYWAQARLRGRADERTRWQIHLAGRRHDDTFRLFPSFPANKHTSHLGTGRAQLRHALRPDLAITAGLTGQLRGIESNNLGTHGDAAGGAFLSARWQPVRHLTVSGSSRLDYDPAYGLELSPQLYLAVRAAGPLTLRAGVGRAVRGPTYTERYYNTTREVALGNLGNPDLAPERAWSAEAGADIYPAEGLAVHATTFARRSRNLIDYATRPPNDSLFVAQNIHRVRTRGLELEGEATRQLSVGRLHLGVAYTLLDADLGEVEEGVQYGYTLTRARHLVQGRAALRTGPFTLGVQALWKERMTTTVPAQDESYGVASTRLGYRLPLGEQHLAFSAEVRNLFDTEYYAVLDAPMPERWWILGAQLEF